MQNAPLFVADRMDEGLPNFLCEHVSDCVTKCNEVIQDVAPWEVAKRMENESDKRSLLAAALYHFAESLRIIAILISPVLPKSAHGIFDQLNWKMELSGKEERFSLADAEWGKLPDGHVVGKPTPLFPRFEQ
jgi:methionyl-tRNA synthetase